MIEKLCTRRWLSKKMWSEWSSKIKRKVILEVSIDFKIYFIYTAYSYRMKKILHLNLCCLVLPKNPKTLYSGHLVIGDTFLRYSRCPLSTGLTVGGHLSNLFYIGYWLKTSERVSFRLKSFVALALIRSIKLSNSGRP